MAVLTLAIIVVSAGASQSSDQMPAGRGVSVAEVGAQSRSMIGWTTFCEAQPAECAPEKLTPVRVMLTAAAWSELAAINDLVNREIQPIADDEHYGIYRMGIRNWWTYPDDGKGNCNDYVLLKRKLLIKAGWPKSALSMTVVLTPKGEGHLVLMVQTDRGDLILDNVHERVLVWNETGYEFIRRQADDDHNVWVSFRHGGASVLQTSSDIKLLRFNSR